MRVIEKAFCSIELQLPVSYGCLQCSKWSEHCWIPKKKAQYFSSKRGGVSVTSTSEEHINAQPDLPIYALLGAFQTSAVLLYPVVELSWAVKSLRTVTSAFTICVMHHRCLFCQTLDCCKMHINVSRHLWWDYSLVRVGLPSTLRLLHHVYVK